MKIFMIGICGVSMSALCNFLVLEGHEVCGSDVNYQNKPACLEKTNVFKQPYLKGVREADLIVKSSAIKENKETSLAKKLGKKIVTRGELLGQISRRYEKVIAVAGSHGKTTTTAMIFHTLLANGKNPTLHLGGNLKDVGNFYNGGKEFFVTEACEYYDNFLNLKPYLGIITNVEPEHLDYFKSFKNEKKSYKKFEENCKNILKKPKKRAKKIKINNNFGVDFSLYKKNKKIDEISLNIGGKINCKNAIFCIEACEKLGLNLDQIKYGLKTFKGVKKRCEKIDSNYFFDIFVDYAHHPKEIQETFNYFKELDKKKIVIFQPHTYSRTKQFLKAFVKSLSNFDEVVCYKTYPAREKPKDGLSAKDLYEKLLEKGRSACYIESLSGVKKFLKKVDKNSVVIFMGAGDLPDKFNFKEN